MEQLFLWEEFGHFLGDLDGFGVGGGQELFEAFFPYWSCELERRDVEVYKATLSS